MSAVWFLAALWVGAALGFVIAGVLAGSSGPDDRRHRMEVKPE